MQSELIIRIKKLMGEDSNVAFARKVGLSEGSIRKLLNGGTPHFDTLVKIARACGVTNSWLVDDSPLNTDSNPDEVVSIETSVAELRSDRRVSQSTFKEAQSVADVNYDLLEAAEVAVHRYYAREAATAPPERMARQVVALYKIAAVTGMARSDDLNQLLKLIS